MNMFSIFCKAQLGRFISSTSVDIKPLTLMNLLHNNPELEANCYILTYEDKLIYRIQYFYSGNWVYSHNILLDKYLSSFHNLVDIIDTTEIGMSQDDVDTLSTQWNYINETFPSLSEDI